MIQRPMGEVEPLPLIVLRPGRLAVAQGAPCPGSWRVESGLLWVRAVSADGRRLALDIAGPGDLVGEPQGEVSPCEVRAIGPARLRPVADEEVASAHAARHRREIALALDLAYLAAPARVERRLVTLAERLGRPATGGLRIPTLLTQEDVASLAATSRETVSRAIHQLVRDGRIEVERRGRYLVRSQLRLVHG